MMKIIIRADASFAIGSGHIMRSLVLANALKNQGHQVQFACLPLSGNLISFIQKKHKVICLSAVKEQAIEDDGNHLAWLQRSVKQDADDFLSFIKTADWVITDHYAIDFEWQTIVKKALNCKIFAIDDLLRKHNADLLLDPTLDRKPSDYTGNGVKLIGSDHALLASAFSYYHSRCAAQIVLPKCINILISMGGVDAPNATLHVLKQLVGKIDANFTVLLKSDAPHYQDVKKFCLSQPNIKHLDFVDNMAMLLMRHQLVIGAIGVSSWERACLGIPSVVIPLAQNQRPNCQKLVEKQAVIAVELSNLSHELLPALNQLIENYHAFRVANLSLCDGRGLYRILAAFEQFSANNTPQLQFIRATKFDIQTVFEWRNHPNVRQYSSDPNALEWQAHQRWMKNKIDSFQDYFLLITTISSSILYGVVRLDWLKASTYQLSIYIAPKFQRQGIAQAALALLDRIFPDVTIKACVLKANLASQQLFKQSGFYSESAEVFIRKPLR